MINHSQKAVELFGQGYNCAQSVFAAFCEELGMDFETGLKLSSSFGGGMGGMHEVCGAVTAIFAIAGLKRGWTAPKDDDAKTVHRELIQELASRFKAENGSIICRDLLADIDPENNELKHQFCSKYVSYAAKLAEELISK